MHHASETQGKSKRVSLQERTNERSCKLIRFDFLLIQLSARESMHVTKRGSSLGVTCNVGGGEGRGGEGGCIV